MSGTPAELAYLHARQTERERRPAEPTTLQGWLEACVAEAGANYTPRGVLMFLRSPNAMLGGRVPIDLIEQGKGGEVLAVLRGTSEGVFV